MASIRHKRFTTLFKTATKKGIGDMSLIRAGKLSPAEVLKAASALRLFVKNHHRRTHRWCWIKLRITKQLFYRFFAISRWSKKTKTLVEAHQTPLSQSALFRLADRKWKDARQLFNKLSQLIKYLSHRKRNSLKELKNKVVDKVGAYLKNKANPLQKVYELTYMINGEKGAISSTDPKALNQRMKKIRGYVYLGIRLVPS